jgi:hypothetical protein
MTTAMAILLPNWLGDAVMASTTLRALRRGVLPFVLLGGARIARHRTVRPLSIDLPPR